MPVQYPSTLPGPSGYPFVPRERRASPGTRGIEQVRARARDAIVDAIGVRWRYTPAEFAIWLTWYEEALFIGQKWFLVNLPGRGGVLPRVARYAGPVQRNHLANGNFELTADLELRGIAQPPEDRGLIYFTSLPYPIELGESIDAPHALPQLGMLWAIPDEGIDAPHAQPLPGTLLDVLLVYDLWPSEGIDAPHAIPLAGTLVDVLLVYDLWPAEGIDSPHALPLAGTLEEVLITYDTWLAEGIDAPHAIPLAGTLA